MTNFFLEGFAGRHRMVARGGNYWIWIAETNKISRKISGND